MKGYRKIQIAGALALGLFGSAVLAHHSGAMFDRNEVRELHGTIKEFQFTNPHTWIQVNVPNEKGEIVEWSVEWGSPNQLRRQGVHPNTFPPGAEVTIRVNPMTDGSPAASFIGAKFKDGTVIGRWEN
ncbi:MAG: DUF6152 family protein [Gammaproteobacteria bacterium]